MAQDVVRVLAVLFSSRMASQLGVTAMCPQACLPRPSQVRDPQWVRRLLSLPSRRSVPPSISRGGARLEIEPSCPGADELLPLVQERVTDIRRLFEGAP